MIQRAAPDPQLFSRVAFAFSCSPHPDILQALADPRLCPPWHTVQVVQVRSTLAQLPACPICLDSPPTAPRVGQCGHAICFPCALQFLTKQAEQHEHNIAFKCPLCQEKVTVEDLKILKFIIVQNIPAAGSRISFNLVKKIKSPFQLVIPSADLAQRNMFRRISLVYELSPYLIQERNNLLEMKRAVMDSGQDLQNILPFYDMALMCIDQQELSWFQGEAVRQSFVPPKYADPSLCSEDQITVFYQMSDGSPLFLHSVNYKCLVAEFGSHRLPLEITGEILEIESFQQNASTLKRFRFLNHLPLDSQFYMCELDLSHLLSSSTKGLNL
jgi:hypothetical protein